MENFYIVVMQGNDIEERIGNIETREEALNICKRRISQNRPPGHRDTGTDYIAVYQTSDDMQLYRFFFSENHHSVRSRIGTLESLLVD